MRAAQPSKTPSPLRSLARRYLLLGGVVVAAGGSLMALGSFGFGAVALLAGAFFLGLGALVRVSGDAAGLVNRAYNAALSGRVEEAEKLLDEVEAERRLRYIQRVVDLQRALLALRRGDREAAKVRVAAALGPAPSWLARLQEGSNIAGARAVRALLRAADGDRAGAREDILAVREAAAVTPEVRARAEVAEAMVREAEGDRGALAAHLRAERRVLFDHTAPRERALVRAFERMLAAPRTTVYRKAAPREAEGVGAPSVSDWVAQLAPAAAPFARATRAPEAAAARSEGEAREPVRAKHREAANTRLEARGVKPGKVLALWVLLVLLALAIWQFLTPSDHAAVAEIAEPVAGAGAWLWALPGALFAVLVGVLVWRVRGAQTDERRLHAALVPLARGEEGAVETLDALTRSSSKLVAASAELHLARAAERRADFAEALRRCDQGIAAATAQPALRALASQILLPDLAAERAVVLAALGREAEAHAEISVVANSFPAHPYLARGELRVALVGAARRGDVGAAARVAEGAGEATLPLAEETLADLARAAAHPESAGPGESARLRELLRQDADLRRFLEAVAPAVLAAFERAEQGAEEEADAEHEALAEAEAEAAGARGSASS